MEFFRNKRPMAVGLQLWCGRWTLRVWRGGFEMGDPFVKDGRPVYIIWPFWMRRLLRHHSAVCPRRPPDIRFGT